MSSHVAYSVSHDQREKHITRVMREIDTSSREGREIDLPILTDRVEDMLGLHVSPGRRKCDVCGARWACEYGVVHELRRSNDPGVDSSIDFVLHGICVSMCKQHLDILNDLDCCAHDVSLRCTRCDAPWLSCSLISALRRTSPVCLKHQAV